ncbi:ankyrin repeat-containing domain protein [Amanita rubescens]|nr:ankyrin repeat-containing domain protein [Amanita rubescens]
MNSCKRALSTDSQTNADTQTKVKKVKGNDMHLQPQAVTHEWDMEVDSNYAAQEHRQSSTANDGVRILEHAQGVLLDKCTINAASRDMIFITNNMTISIDSFKQWLSPPDPSTNLNNALKSHLFNTGSWLLNSPAYFKWKQRDNSFLWIHGISGSGKTILCSTLIQAIQKQTDSKSSALAYFFCDVSDINKRTARGLLCSLILTLLTPQNQSVLKVLFEKCKNGLQKPTDHDLYEVLRSYLSGFQDVYLFIDALDECANVEEVLELVKLINRWSIRSCHLLVTSRKELPIVNSLRQAMPMELDLTSMPVNQDIEKYIDHMLFTATELKTWKPNAKELIKVTLMEKGKGMFRWVACQLEELKPCSKSQKMLRQKLNSLPTTLNSTYDQILTRIAEADAMNAMKLLLWLTFSERPIHMEDLALILEYDVESQQYDVDAKLDYPDDVLKICSSLVAMMEDETVQFAHASIKEYFQSDKRKIGSSVIVNPHFGHYFIGQCSLAYILQRKEVIHASTRFDKSLIRYAAYFWPKHILACKQESAVMNQIINLFESQSLTYWVKAYNYEWWKHVNENMQYPNYLQIAAIHGLIETAKWLMLQPVSNVECMEALYAAACNGHINMVKLLLEKGNIKVETDFYCWALEKASLRGHKQVVRLLCKHGKDSDMFRTIVNVAISLVLEDQHIEALKLLLDSSGVNLIIGSYNARDAAEAGNIELVQLVLEKVSNQKERKKIIFEVVEVAAYAGHKAIVELLLRSEVGLSEHSASLRGPASEKESHTIYRNELLARSLINAAKGGHKDIVEILLESGAGMGAKANAVVHASRRGYLHIVELLLDRGIEVNVHRGHITHALCAAAGAGHEELVRFLIEQGADPNVLREDGENPLHVASLRGYKHIAQLLIDNEADVNAQGGQYGYAIWAAMSEGYNEIVELLLQHGASPSVHGGYDTEALEAACKGGYRNIVELLLDEGVDVNATTRDGNALISAVKGGHKSIVKLLLERGADVNVVEAQMNTALQIACDRSDKDTVQLLLAWGADVNIVGGEWGTALQAASHKGKKDTVQLLLEWGANVNIQAGKYGSALIAAAARGHKPMVGLLLEWGADVNLHGGVYGSALIAAIYYRHKAIAEMLLLKGADVNFCNEKYGTALIQAAESFGKKDIVEMLLQCGADVNIQGENGSALYVAANRDHTKIAQLLLAHGAKYLGRINDAPYLMASYNEENDSDSMESDSD